jgi:hypothetical protein
MVLYGALVISYLSVPTFPNSGQPIAYRDSNANKFYTGDTNRGLERTDSPDVATSEYQYQYTHHG